MATLSEMPETKRSENFSLAYIRAIAAKAGMIVWRPEDDFGTDLAFTRIVSYQPVSTKRHRRYIDPHNVSIPFQVKSTKNWEDLGDKIRYDLEATAFDDLIYRRNTSLLLVMCLPQTVEEWLVQDKQKLQLHHCCYYWEPDEADIMTPNDSTKRIFIPSEQVFTPDALTEMFERRQGDMTHDGIVG